MSRYVGWAIYIYIYCLKIKKNNFFFLKKNISFLKPHFGFSLDFFLLFEQGHITPDVLQLVILSVIFIRVHCIDLQRYRLHIFFDT